MTRFDPVKHHRRSIRLRGYDYSQFGHYAFTICVQHWKCLLGRIDADRMQLNDAGKMVESWWIELDRKFPSIRTDKFVVMPNHFHGIVVLQANPDADSAKSDRLVCPPQPNLGIVGADLRVRPAVGRAHRRAPTLAAVVKWFKTMTTNGYIRGVRTHQWVPFPGKLWQRGYFERIIRDENELDRIREYIELNPARWARDPQNPGSNPKGRP